MPWTENFLAYLATVSTPCTTEAMSSLQVAVCASSCIPSAAQTATLLNVSNLASSVGLSRPSISAYLGLLERVFMLELLRPWHSNRLRRLVKTPKLHIGDTGLACALLGVNARSLAKHRGLLGQLLESFVFQELRRQASWHDAPMEFFHFRDKDQVEVDIVIERGALALAGVEVKASGTVTGSDFRGLRRLRRAVGNRFAAGVVLYDGEVGTSFGDRLFAVPIHALWEPAACPPASSPLAPPPRSAGKRIGLTVGILIDTSPAGVVVLGMTPGAAGSVNREVCRIADGSWEEHLCWGARVRAWWDPRWFACGRGRCRSRAACAGRRRAPPWPACRRR